MMVLALCAVIALDASAERRRALLIGIDDYTASTLGARPKELPARDWPNLAGATNDVAAMAELLTLLYGFPRNDITTLTSQSATREAILNTIEEHLVEPAAKGDVVLFYYGGHGSQVRNSASAEPDRMDESIVPADSRTGAPDIRDKELRSLFNRILERGAKLTIILDNCHSGSGARGRVARGIAPDLRDVRDGRRDRAPEENGALVIAATQDFDTAWETRDEQGKIHGAFSWALLRAMRDAAPNESATDTFLRAQARLRGETPYQEPVLAGNAARNAPFLGTTSPRSERRSIAVERVTRDGTVQLQGGWVNGLTAGTKLRSENTILIVTALHGLGRSEARLEKGPPVRAGALLEIVSWAAPPVRPLRVRVPSGLTFDGVEITDQIEEADYALTRRPDGKYAWVRPRPGPGLPSRTAWQSSIAEVRESLLRLRRIHAWHSLESPPASQAPYALGIVQNGAGHSLRLLARSRHDVSQRYYYAFSIDDTGRGVLLFPRLGSVENRFPLSPEVPPVQIELKGSAFQIAPPYGNDTIFLLSADEPLPNPWLLELDGVRARPLAVQGSWSIEKVLLQTQK